MAELITWTTPTITEVVEGVDISDYDLYITIEQISPSGSLRARVTSAATATYDGADTYVSADFTEEQTSQLKKGHATVMVNAIGDGVRYATFPITVGIEPNALPEEVS